MAATQPSTGYTGFRYISPTVTEAEARVIAAGYPWANITKLRKPGPLPRFEDHKYFDYLGIHTHSGNNTHLIIDGDITIRQHPSYKPPVTLLTLPDGLNRSRYVTLSPDIEACKELPLGGGEIYEGTTKGGVSYVDAHRCLSPKSASRMMEREVVYWVEQGFPVRGKLQDQIMETLADDEFDHRWTEEAPCLVELPSRYGLPNETRRKLCEWFRREWEHHERPEELNDRPDKKAVNVEGLYPVVTQSWFGKQRQLEASTSLYTMRARTGWVPQNL